MTKSKMANRYSPEVRARVVRMVFEHQGKFNDGVEVTTHTRNRAV